MSFVGVGQNLCVCPSFPFGIEGGMWDVVVLIPDHCLSIYFSFTNFACPKNFYRNVIVGEGRSVAA